MRAPFSRKIIANINHFQRNKNPLRCDCGERLYASKSGLYCNECGKILVEVSEEIANYNGEDE